ncbi:hypothetical protein CMV_028297 [Castanea mollissima]|uniref:Uncharacterized protein n=1 Tax=Castanea mollissima TaxID=60419 RepID=A0A8J4QG40_9ROSI|nr:hypothetical protein CMV_028297 [Castanea mollissima]
MSSFPAKLMATIVAVLLLVCDFSATSASVHYGVGKSSLLASARKDGSMKTLPIEEGSTKGLNVKSKKIVFFRSLRDFQSPPPVHSVHSGPTPGEGS